MTQPLDSSQPAKHHSVGIDLFAVIATFGAYFCMYMYRKPFTAASYETMTAFGMAYKPVAVISQVLGYTLSKFMGIKVISEAGAKHRVLYYLGMIGIAEVALLLFGLTPSPWNLVWLFMNGLPLGMVFGLVLAYLEGRVRTEALTAGLCVSFVVADGVAKSSGAWLMEKGVPETWMPAATGAMFLPGIFLFGWMLSKIPGQSEEDIALRSKREPMDKAQRRAFFGKFAVGFSLLIAMYSLVGVLRGVRGDFAKEIWAGLNTKVDPALFSQTELIVAFSCLAIIACLVLIRDNEKAFGAGLLLSGFGLSLILVSLIGLQGGWINPFYFVVLIGLGLYLPYIAIHATVFERLIAYTREKATIGYLMYLADATSYAMLVGLLFYKNLGTARAEQILPSFLALSWFVAIACLLMLPPTWLYFRKKRQLAEGQA